MKEETFTRTCAITGEKLTHSGWVWCDGSFYTGTEEATLKECRAERANILYDIDEHSPLQDSYEAAEYGAALKRAQLNTESDDDLMLIGYQTGYLYYTEFYGDEN
tara:strand:- start:321 stop:635 length:315 start_codon:yes stop_codon:yes gene_type:complete